MIRCWVNRKFVNAYTVRLILILIFVVISSDTFSQQLFKPSLKDINRSSYLTLADTITDKPVKFKMRKNPWVAVGLSAILPGAGQLYNKSYWKIPVIAGLGGYFAYVIIKNNNDFIDYKDLYLASQTAENPEGDLRLKSLREFYRDQRDRFMVFAGILYLINLVDAYIDAHLYDFDVSENVNFGVGRGSRLLEMRVNF